MTRNVFAVVFGIVLAVILIMVVQTIGHSVYPPPTNVDYENVDELAAYVENLPLGALLFVMAAWVVGTCAGGLLACFIAKDRPFAYASMVGGAILFATIYTLLQLPHPLWFSITSVSAICMAIYVTGRLGMIFTKTEIAGHAD